MMIGFAVVSIGAFGQVPLRVCVGTAEAAVGVAVLVWAVVGGVRRSAAGSTATRWFLWSRPPARGFGIASGAFGAGITVWGVGEALPGLPGYVAQLTAVAIMVLAGLGVAVTFPPDPPDGGRPDPVLVPRDHPQDTDPDGERAEVLSARPVGAQLELTAT